MAGTSVMYPCPNIPPILRVETMTEFCAERVMENPINLLYRHTKEANYSSGVFTSIYALGQTLEKLEKSLLC